MPFTRRRRRTSRNSSFQPSILTVTAWVSLGIIVIVSLLQQRQFDQHDPTADIKSIRSSSTLTCSDYQGVLLISHGPRLAAAATVFFQYVVNQLSYAERYNLLPLIHLSTDLKHIYDPSVHGKVNTTFVHQDGMTISSLNDSDAPGPPLRVSTLKSKQYTLPGDGIWNHYFEPLPYKNCSELPLLQFSAQQIKPGLHAHADWAIRSWRYGDLPDAILQPHLSDKDWYAPMRQAASRIVAKYIRFQSQLRYTPLSGKPCLGLHVRHSDKGAERRLIAVKDFVPYLQAYAKAGGRHAYLATDSSHVQEELQQSVNSTIMLHSQPNTLLSSSRTAVFNQHKGQHHVTNQQVLQDIYALSQCSWLLHGRSAVSEAVMYLRPDLHRHSVDLEDATRYSVEDFRRLVGEVRG
jgi:hypothetical protein